MSKSNSFWDRAASKATQGELLFGETMQKTIDNTLALLKKEHRILDFACGSGTITCVLAANVEHIHGIDISAKMIAAAQQNCANRNISNIDFAQQLLEDNCFEPQQFDVILAFNIIHLLEHKQQALTQLHGLLKPGGLLISSTACLAEKFSFAALLLKILSTIRIIPPINYYRLADMERLINQAGFSISQTQILNHSLNDYFIVAQKK
jgi:2-polyprenyl-3-methyl-5-hydroxy-6-metoxy-1,4-benzoquinol methylase